MPAVMATVVVGVAAVVAHVVVMAVEAVKAVETDSPAATARTTFEDEIDESLLIPGTTLPDGRKVVADWKGDPMVLNPGDRMPRF